MAENNMSETHQIIASALQLPLDGRISLLNAVLKSVDKPAEKLTQFELDKSWAEEIASRVNNIDSGSVTTVSSSEFGRNLAGSSIPILPFGSCEPNALASGVTSGLGPRVARSIGILLMPDASANGSQV